MLGRHDACNDLDGVLRGHHVAFGVELHDRTLYQGGLVDLLAGNLGAEAVAESLVLLVNHLLGDLDGVERHLDVLVHLDVEGGSQTHLILEGVVFLLHVDFLDLLGERFAEDVDFVFAEIFDYRLEDLVVEHVALNVAAKETAEMFDGNMAFAESGDLAGAAKFAKVAVNLLCVVCFNHLNLDGCVEVVGLFKCDLHFLCWAYIVLYDFSNCKITLKNPTAQA